MQAYSDPTRAHDPHALPDLEIFYLSDETIGADRLASHAAGVEPSWEKFETGWYWWSCFPGCLPDGDPHGPFPQYADALADAREGVNTCRECGDPVDPGATYCPNCPKDPA
jgi:hypothetical protein